MASVGAPASAPSVEFLEWFETGAASFLERVQAEVSALRAAAKGATARAPSPETAKIIRTTVVQGRNCAILEYELKVWREFLEEARRGREGAWLSRKPLRQRDDKAHKSSYEMSEGLHGYDLFEDNRYVGYRVYRHVAL